MKARFRVGRPVALLGFDMASILVDFASLGEGGEGEKRKSNCRRLYPCRFWRPVVGSMVFSSCRGTRSTRADGSSCGSEGKLMRRGEGGGGGGGYVAVAGGRRAGEGGRTCSSCSWSEGAERRNGGASVFVFQKNLHTEVQGHYGAVAGLGLIFLFNAFLFLFLPFFPSPCCYAAIFFNGVMSPRPALSRLGVV
jgi:hypothetical protein